MSIDSYELEHDEATDRTITFSEEEWAAFKTHLGLEKRDGPISAESVIRAMNVNAKALSFSHTDGTKTMRPEDTPIVKDAEQRSELAKSPTF